MGDFFIMMIKSVKIDQKSVKADWKFHNWPKSVRIDQRFHNCSLIYQKFWELTKSIKIDQKVS